MENSEVFARIKHAIDHAPRNGYVAELHVQILKHADVLERLSGKEFCEKVGLGPAWGSEFAKMMKLAPRLRAAGLQPESL